MLHVYHHNDLDGRAAAYVVHKYKPSSAVDSILTYHEISDHDAKYDRHTINGVIKDDVVIVDLGVNENTLQNLLDVCKTARTVTFIDHHQSSLDVINNHKKELQNIENLTYFVAVGICGSALAYCYFNIPTEDLKNIRTTIENEYYHIDAKSSGFSKVTVTGTKYGKREDKKDNFKTPFMVKDFTLPLWLAHVDDYDCWKQLNNATDAFVLGTDVEDTRMIIENDYENYEFNPFWERLDSLESCLEYITNGRLIAKYINARYSRELKYTFEWEFNGTKFICKNAPGNSWNFGRLLTQYDAAILFKYDGSVGKWTYSVYAHDKSEFNCTEFCKMFGGGGHFHASGFSTTTPIFTDPNLLEKLSKESKN